MIFIHKKGPLEDLRNYRTLTIIISLCGLYSKLLNERLNKFVELSNILGEMQNGFRKGRSCADNNFILHTILEKARVKRKKVYLRYCFLSLDREMVK